ncbi:MAG: deoxyribonuclease HsdR [Proteobacteria bacterium]|nr:MAG: deoxyribonuclease HsdR [Pseudomonadota bacterium]
MPSIPTERTAVQEPILRYASAIGWTRLSKEAALTLRGGESGTLLYPLLREKLIELNPGIVTPENVDAIIARIEGVRPSIEGNAEVLAWLRGERTVFVESERRQRNVVLIDFEQPARNAFQVTDEWEYTNGQYTNRADVLFLINGIPVALVEAKNPRRRDGIHEGLVQVRRYHRETPELLVTPQVFDVTHLVHFFYGATWSLERKTLFNWKDEEPGNFERKVKRFFARERFLRLLRDWILVVRKDDELRKVVLRQHQTRAVERAVERCLDPAKRRGLVWHTQGSGKTFTMIAAAEQVLGNPAFAKPTVLLLVDRNELETQLFANLESYGMPFEPATSKARLRELLRSGYRGLIVAMIHKFEAADADLCTRDDVFVFVDEAHRSTGGTLGNYLLGALPNATFIGFTGTPIDRTAHGEGTFKVFGIDDPPKGYLDKYAIRESIEDETTLKLRYTLAPNEIRVPRDVLEAEFLSLYEAEGVSDIEELDRILARAVHLKAFLKAEDRVAKVARFVAEHFRENVEPLGYKAFLVGVDREACALYKKALDRHLPPEASAVVYTKAHNDSARLAEFHLTDDQEKRVRQAFRKPGEDPKILIVTEKLLTGFDAPILYCMYLDKPMRDHTLLQAIARVNRPYEDEGETRKPSGLVIDFVGVFERLEKALRFDSEDVAGLLEDVAILRERFAALMADPAPRYLALFGRTRDDKAVEERMEQFADRDARDAFYEFFRELRTLYEVLSPDAALRPWVDDYTKLSVLYDEVTSFYATGPVWDLDLARKTERLVREHAESDGFRAALPIVEINEKALDALARSGGPPRTKVFNLARTLAQAARARAAEQPYLVPIGERAEAIVEAFDDRQMETQQALGQLERLVAEFQAAERERAETGFDLPTFTIYQLLGRESVEGSAALAPTLAVVLARFPNRAHNASELRAVKAALYKELLAVVGKDRMVALAEQILRLVRT